VCVPLNANELLLSAQRAEFQELVYVCVCVSSSDYLTQASTKMSETVLPFMFKLKSDKDGKTQEQVA